MTKVTLPLDVQEYLLTAAFPLEGCEGESAIFTCPADDLLKLGFARCVDYPQLREHVYYEGYFHSLRQAEAVQSLNPRRGYPFDKPPAPVALRAFYTAFREANRAKFDQIIANLAALQTPSTPPPEQEALEALVRLFNPDGDSLLGDLAIQVHSGTAVDEMNVGWHTDSINSIFHLATSIRGSRKLFSFLHEKETVPEYDKWQPYCDELHQGDVYISSPAFFRHGVGYPDSEWSGRTVAIQARFLLKPEDFSRLRTVDSEEIREAVARIVAEAISTGFLWPSLEEIKAVATQLDHFTGDLVLKRNLDETKSAGFNAY